MVPVRKVTVSGRRFTLDGPAIVEAMADVLPEPIHEHYVVVGGRRYPPKQVIGVITGLDRADFTTHQARRVLLRLGFPAARRSAGRSQRPAGTESPGTSSPRAAGTESPGTSTARRAEALRPYIGEWVATRDDEVLVAARSAREVVAWLAEHGQSAASMFRVPDGDVSAGGAAPQ